MTLITLYFFAHQPDRLLPYDRRRSFGRTARDLHQHYFDDELNEQVFRKVAGKCYYPATRLILELVERHRDSDKPFRVAYGLSGTLLDQIERYDTGLLDLFRRLSDTGLVEFTGEVYYHSLAGLFDAERREFQEEARMHADRLESLFGRRPAVFRNTECMFNNGIAATVQAMGYEGIITEGVDWLLAGWRSPDFVYRATCGLPVLMRNYQLSDDLGYRFSNRDWEGWPLRAETFAGWLAGNTDMNVVLALDYEALGEHIWADSGIFEFLRHLPDEVMRYPQLAFTTPTEAVRTLPTVGEVSVDDYATISWADQERDTSAWLGNEMQRYCHEELKRMEGIVKRARDAALLDCWRRMLTSDHLYYLATKSFSDQDVHKYFSAYGSVVEGFVRLHTAAIDLWHRAEKLAGEETG
ncbi:MAG: alpha-amylase [Chthonomonadales bacterium]|nr:alpha-amylase [Chthonomonadales bacterium]